MLPKRDVSATMQHHQTMCKSFLIASHMLGHQEKPTNFNSTSSAVHPQVDSILPASRCVFQVVNSAALASTIGLTISNHSHIRPHRQQNPIECGTSRGLLLQKATERSSFGLQATVSTAIGGLRKCCRRHVESTHLWHLYEGDERKPLTRNSNRLCRRW